MGWSKTVGGGVLWWAGGGCGVGLCWRQWGTGKRGMWTNGDRVMLVVMVETRVDRVVRCGHGEYQLENRSAQKGSRSAGSRPTRLARNVSGTTSMTRRRFWSSWAGWRRSTSGSRAVSSRFAQKGSGVDTSTARRARRRCRACWHRGETLAAIAELAGVKVSEVRAVLKSSERTTGRAAGCTRRAQRRETARRGRRSRPAMQRGQ